MDRYYIGTGEGAVGVIFARQKDGHYMTVNTTEPKHFSPEFMQDKLDAGELEKYRMIAICSTIKEPDNYNELEWTDGDEDLNAALRANMERNGHEVIEYRGNMAICLGIVYWALYEDELTKVKPEEA